MQDLRRTLAQLRKKMAKQGSEMNDLQLHLESQQARNIELEKKQKKLVCHTYTYLHITLVCCSSDLMLNLMRPVMRPHRNVLPKSSYQERKIQ